MKLTPTKKSFPISKLVLLVLFLLGTFNYSLAQFQIVGMQVQTQSGWTPTNSVNMTISIPGQAPYTGQVIQDARKQYPSGTTFVTPPNTSISVFHAGQMQIMGGNSTLKVVVLKDGMSAQTLSGQVRHVLSDVKNKVGYYRAGNGYTWAHAEGTNFVVTASSKSKAVNIQTDEGRVVITDEVPVQIGQSAVTEGGGRGARELKTVVRTVNEAGQQYTTQAQTQPKKFRTYAEAIAEFEAETNRLEESGQGYYEELADKFALIGELYMDIGEYDRAQEPLYKAFEYTEALDSEDLYVLDIMLYLAEACIYGTDSEIQKAGVDMVRGFIEEGEVVLSDYIADYKYANDLGDADWAWDLCYDLGDLNEYLGWAHDLLNQEEKAEFYYKWADNYTSRL